MTARTDLVLLMTRLVGPELTIEAVGTGWPALGTLADGGTTVPVAIFVSQVGLSHRGRDDVERRFQNPAGGTPLVEVPGRVSMLVGIWYQEALQDLPAPVLVIADAGRRADGRTTRWSVFVPLTALKEALTSGWATHHSDSGEVLRCVHPALLTAVAEALSVGVEPPGPTVRMALSASGMLADHSADTADPAVKRARRAVLAIVRDAKFSRRVLDAYDRRCAMCGLGLALTQGAHIYPASAPGSQDEPWNGIALCGNHHLAFDRHILAVLPPGMAIVFRPDVVAQAATDPAVRLLLDSTEPVLRQAQPEALPRPDVFFMRYQYYSESYQWLGHIDAR